MSSFIWKYPNQFPGDKDIDHQTQHSNFVCLFVCLSIAHSLHWGHIFFIYSFIWQKMKFNFFASSQIYALPLGLASFISHLLLWMNEAITTIIINSGDGKENQTCNSPVHFTCPIDFAGDFFHFSEFLDSSVMCIHCRAYFHSLWMTKWTIYQLIIKLNQTFSHSFHWIDWLIDVIQKCQKQQLVILLMLNTVERIKADNQSKTRTLCLAPDGRNSDFENFRTFFTAVIIKW